MIIWKGLGILTIIIPVGLMLLFQLTISNDELWGGIGVISVE